VRTSKTGGGKIEEKPPIFSGTHLQLKAIDSGRGRNKLSKGKKKDRDQKEFIRGRMELSKTTSRGLKRTGH